MGAYLLIAISHNLVLVVASIAVSLVAAFTGLALTNSIASLPDAKRKMLVVMSAFIIGGGIWSMHFVAMLAHEFAVPVYYDSLQTLGSALIAILVVGAALLMLHFSKRTPNVLVLSGLLLGAGVIVMHYVGMLAIRGVIPRFNIISVLLAVAAAAVAGVLAIRVAYGSRSKQNTVIGSLVFGLAVVAVHYAAMLGTTFHHNESFKPLPVAMANHTLAISVTIASFVICGAFLLATTGFVTQKSAGSGPLVESEVGADKGVLPDTPAKAIVENVPADAATVESGSAADSLQVPFEKNKKVGYVGVEEIAAARADGHYTQIYTKSGVHFCPWSITEAEAKLAQHGFCRTHRSYLVNINAVDDFQKRKEAGVCLFSEYPNLSSVPVSRNRVISLLAVLDNKTDIFLGQTGR